MRIIGNMKKISMDAEITRLTRIRRAARNGALEAQMRRDRTTQNALRLLSALQGLNVTERAQSAVNGRNFA